MAGQNHFDRDRAVQTHLARLEHDTHPAPADLFNQLIVPKVAQERARARAGGFGPAILGAQIESHHREALGAKAAQGLGAKFGPALGTGAWRGHNRHRYFIPQKIRREITGFMLGGSATLLVAPGCFAANNSRDNQ